MHSSAGVAPRYRADIDGLRALAIVPVVLFHARVPGFDGGFIGVDVFFVLSGFLITRLLMSTADKPAGEVLANFYVRRARRILPALLAMLAVVAAVSLVVLLPADLERLGQSLALAAISLGNVGAWLAGAYFETAPRALVHLWSIAVEEQFYLVYPLVFRWLVRPLAGGRAWPLIALAVVSFLIGAWASHAYPLANFYSPVSRAWQLLMGAIVAIGGWRTFGGKVRDEIASIVALLVLAICFAAFHELLRHPGVVTLIPCLATAVLLIVDRPTMVTRLLSLRALVFVGLISYSIYLWHAPMLVLARYYMIEVPGAASLAVQMAAVFVVSVLSWRWIEQPLRTRRRLPSNRAFLWSAAAASATLCAVGVWLYTSRGLPQRFAPEMTGMTDVRGVAHLGFVHCIKPDPAEVARGHTCEFGAERGARRALIWGDSHAWASLSTWDRLGSANDTRVYFSSSSACPPLLGGTRVRASDISARRCADFNAAMLEAVRNLEPDIVVLQASWVHALDLRKTDDAASTSEDSLFANGLHETVRRIAAPGRTVCIVRGVPRVSESVPYLLGMSRRKEIDPERFAPTRAATLDEQHVSESAIDALAARGLVRDVDPKRLLCPGRRCLLQGPDGAVLYFDSNHLSLAGAEFVAPELQRCFTGASGPAE